MWKQLVMINQWASWTLQH